MSVLLPAAARQPSRDLRAYHGADLAQPLRDAPSTRDGDGALEGCTVRTGPGVQLLAVRLHDVPTRGVRAGRRRWHAENQACAGLVTRAVLCDKPARTRSASRRCSSTTPSTVRTAGARCALDRRRLADRRAADRPRDAAAAARFLGGDAPAARSDGLDPWRLGPDPARRRALLAHPRRRRAVARRRGGPRRDVRRVQGRLATRTRPATARRPAQQRDARVLGRRHLQADACGRRSTTSTSRSSTTASTTTRRRRCGGCSARRWAPRGVAAADPRAACRCGARRRRNTLPAARTPSTTRSLRLRPCRCRARRGLAEEAGEEGQLERARARRAAAGGTAADRARALLQPDGAAPRQSATCFGNQKTVSRCCDTTHFATRRRSGTPLSASCRSVRRALARRPDVQLMLARSFYLISTPAGWTPRPTGR